MQAKPDHCPLHPYGDCGLVRHGYYPRKIPNYCFIARYLCPLAKVTIGLIPDFFCSRFPGTLDEVEEAVNVANNCASQEEAAEKLRSEITLTSALRWLRRRIKYVKDTLTIVTGLFQLECYPSLENFRCHFASRKILVTLRGAAVHFLQSLPPVVGFGHRLKKRYPT